MLCKFMLEWGNCPGDAFYFIWILFNLWFFFFTVSFLSFIIILILEPKEKFYWWVLRVGLVKWFCRLKNILNKLSQSYYQLWKLNTDSEKIIAGYRDDAVKELLVTAKLVTADKILIVVCKNLLPVAVLLMPVILRAKKNLK